MIVGLTGGIGCGKTCAAGFFAEVGWSRIDVDEVVRALLREDGGVLGEIRAAFGPGVFGPDGAVNRHALAALVFSDPEALARLEAILHPRVRAAWKGRIAAQPHLHWVVEIPLLFEKGLEKEVDFTVCVASDPGVQMRRLALRGLPAQEAVQRIARQLPLAQKIERADFVLTNNGTLLFLRDQVDRLVQFLSGPAS